MHERHLAAQARAVPVSQAGVTAFLLVLVTTRVASRNRLTTAIRPQLQAAAAMRCLRADGRDPAVRLADEFGEKVSDRVVRRAAAPTRSVATRRSARRCAQ